MRREPTFDDLDFDDPDGRIRPLRPANALQGSRLVTRLVLAAGVVAGLTMFARERTAPGPSQRAWTEPQRVVSAARVAVPANAAGPLLTMEAVDPPARAEPPRWNAATGLREDAVTLGAFDAIEAPFLRLTMTERGQAAEPSASLFVTLARRAADLQGLAVVRTGVRGTLDTKFGAFETVEMTLSGHGARQCTGFAAVGTKAMRIDGWLCGILGQAPEPQAVACLVDALKLAIATTPTIEVAFGEAELRRGAGCKPPADTAASQRGVDQTGSVGGSKTATGDRIVRRSRKNEAELRRNAEARL